MFWLKSFLWSFIQQYIDLSRSFGLYWEAYGGPLAFLRSPFLHFALLISYVAKPLWHPPAADSAVWYSISLSVLPNLLGFTLGGYAILLAFGDNKFRELISEKTENDTRPSLFMEINGTFVHFILLQALAIVIAVVGTAWTIKSGWFAWLGCTCFLYTVLTAISAALTVLEVSGLFQKLVNHNKTQK